MSSLSWHFRVVGDLLVVGLLVMASAQPAQCQGAAAQNEISKKFVAEFLQEIQVPELLFCPKDKIVFKTADIPGFDPAVLKRYPASSGEQSRVKPSVTRARVLLWALSGQPAPAALADEVKSVRQGLQVDFTVFRDRYPLPANANQFREDLFKESRTHAAVLQVLLDGLEELQLNRKARDDEPARWRGHYDFIEARLMLQIAQVYEYQSMIGLMRKDFPDHDPKVHTAWKLIPKPILTGDFEGKRLARDAHKTLASLITAHSGSPWEVVATRLKDVPVGLEWQATK